MTDEPHSRRKFLLAASTVAVSSAAFVTNEDLQLFIKRSLKGLQSPRSITHLRGGFFQTPHGVNEYGPSELVTNKHVFNWDLATGKTKLIPVQAASHIVHTHPEDSTLSLVGTKHKDTISMVDWKSGKEISTYQLPSGSFFYGHSAFVPGEQHAIIPLRTQSGFAVGIFEFPTLKMVDLVPTNSRLMHEIIPIGGSRFAMGFSSTPEQPPAFGLYDYKTRQLLEFPVPYKRPGLKMSIPHLQIHGDSKIIANLQIQNAYFQSGLASFDLNTRETAVLLDPVQQKIGELLSFTYDPQHENVWITGPSDSIVYIWSIRNNELIHKIKFEGRPKLSNIGLVPDQNLMIIGTPDRLLAYDTKSFQRKPALEEKWPHEIARQGYCAHTRGI